MMGHDLAARLAAISTVNTPQRLCRLHAVISPRSLLFLKSCLQSSESQIFYYPSIFSQVHAGAVLINKHDPRVLFSTHPYTTMDASALRTEIKSWERSFAAEHGRKPTVAEIKADPICESQGRVRDKRNARRMEKGTCSGAILDWPRGSCHYHQRCYFSLASTYVLTQPKSTTFTRN